MVEKKKKFSKKKVEAESPKAKSPELMTDFDLSELVKAAKEVVPDVFIPEKGSLTEVSDWIAMPGPICEVLGDVPGLPCGHGNGAIQYVVAAVGGYCSYGWWNICASPGIFYHRAGCAGRRRQYDSRGYSF